MQRFLKILMVAVLVLAGADAGAAVYYVKTTGLDTNNGLASTTPFKTLTKALTVAQAGDTIYLGGGTYTDQPVTVRGGTASAPITVVGDTLGTYTGTKGTVQFRKAGALMIDVQHANFIFEKVRVSSSGTAFRLSAGATNVVFNTCTVTGCTTAVQMLGGSATFNTLVVTTTTGTVFDTTATTASGGNGTLSCVNSKFYSNSGTIAAVKGYSELTLSRCTIYNNPNAKLMEVTASVNGRSQNLTIANSLLYKNAGSITQNGSNATTKVLNCTLDQMTASKTIETLAGNLTVQNAIFSNCVNALVQTSGSITHTNNMFWNCTAEVTGTAKHSTEFTADPVYTSATSWVPKTGSPAVDAGVTLSGYSTDRAGASRPLGIAYDVGAYEKAGPSSNTPYSQTFETIATPGTEWSLLGSNMASSNIFTITTSGTTTTKVITPQDNSKTLQLRVNTTVDADYTLLLDVVFMGSWDGSSTSNGPDRFGISVNGQPMISGTFRCQTVNGNGSALTDWSWPGFPEECRSNAGNFGGSFSTLGSIFRRVRVDFTAETAVTFINFYGTGLQAWSDEAWAVDNVIVGLTTSTTIINNAKTFEEAARSHNLFAQPRTSGAGVSSSKPALLWADIDKNGYPDAVAHNMSSNSAVFFNTEGSLAPSAAFGSTTDQAMLADLDNDGVIDVVTSGASQRSTIRRGGPAPAIETTPLSSSTFYWNAWPNPVNSSTYTREAMAVLDADGDGWCDLLHTRTGSHEFFLGQADTTGYFVDYARQTGSDSPFDTFFTEDGHAFSGGDVNNDGYPDLFHHGGTGILMLSAGGTGAYTRQSLATGATFSDAAPVGSVWGDVDNDGDLDLIAGNQGGSIIAMRNEGAGASFTAIAATWGITATGTVTPALGDYDNDGDLDLFFTTAAGYSLLYRNNKVGAGTMTFTAVNEGCRTETSGGDAKWVDFNSDGLLDLAFTSNSQNFWTRLYANVRDEANPADANLGR
ncbi:MAG: FG-GAP-like repeat-containing protein, partial [Phycisphaerales bacterium]